MVMIISFITRELTLEDSQIIAKSNASGGNIFIDPIFVILNRSQITADGESIRGGNIDISTEFFIRSQDSTVTASS